MQKKKLGRDAPLHRDLRVLRAARRRARIDAGMLYANRPVTVPDAKKAADKAACRGKVRPDA